MNIPPKKLPKILNDKNKLKKFKAKTLAKDHQEAEPVDNNYPRTIKNLHEDILRIILEKIYAEDPNKLRQRRGVSRIWQEMFLKIAKPNQVTTLCVMANSGKPNFEALNSRFFEQIDLVNAVTIKLKPNGKPRGSLLEKYYPKVTQLVISEQYLGLTRYWKGQITNLSLKEDKGNRQLDQTMASKINLMGSLWRLDLDGHFVQYLDLMEPTLKKLEHLSVNHDMGKYKRFNDKMAYFWCKTLPENLSSKCKSLWFVPTIGCRKFDDKPDCLKWLAALTHFVYDMSDAYKSQHEQNRFVANLSRNAVNLRTVGLFHSYVHLNPEMIANIGRLAQLEELHCDVTVFFAELLEERNRNNLKQLPNVRIADLEILLRGFSQNEVNQNDIDGGNEVRVAQVPPSEFDFVRIVSSILPNVERLTISFQSVNQFKLDHLVSHLDAFPKLLFYKLSTSEGGYVSAKRAAPEGTFDEIKPNDDHLPPSHRLRPIKNKFEETNDDSDGDEDTDESDYDNFRYDSDDDDCTDDSDDVDYIYESADDDSTDDSTDDDDTNDRVDDEYTDESDDDKWDDDYYAYVNKDYSL